MPQLQILIILLRFYNTNIKNKNIINKLLFRIINQQSFSQMANYMDSYLHKNIFKVSQPPGGGSSIRLGWDQPQVVNKKITKNRSNTNHNNSISYQQQHNIRNPENTYMNRDHSLNSIQSNKSNLYQGNYQSQSNNNNNNYNSINQNYNSHNNANNYPQNYPPNYNNYPAGKSHKQYQHPSQSLHLQQQQKYSIPSPLHNPVQKPFSYSKKSYQQYLNPGFVQPLDVDIVTNQRSLHNWGQSSKLLQQQLKFYQQKNRLLKQKVFGGYNNQQQLKNFQGQFHQNKSRKKIGMAISHPSQQLQRAILDRNRNMYPFQIKACNYQMNSPQYQNSNIGNNMSLLNNSIFMQNPSQIKTSVKVHNPPGGRSSIKFG